MDADDFLVGLGKSLGAKSRRGGYGNNHTVGWWWEDRALLGRPNIADGEDGLPELRVTWDGAGLRFGDLTIHDLSSLPALQTELQQTVAGFHGAVSSATR